ncbi:MAG TPA: PilN domain-containing protein, partial [Candidatus Nitrosotenuis sp.]|nr:PilN domain-containing protein [Candidatus Nitrosotenuis sp.]
MTIKVDMLPTERRRFSVDAMMIFLLIIIILVTVGVVLYGADLQKRIEETKAKSAKVTEEIRAVERSLPQIEDLKAENQSLREQIKVVKSLVYDPIRYGNLLKEVSRILPDNVWLGTLSIEPGTQSVTMNGTAAQWQGKQPLATIAELIQNLNNSGMFKDASLSSTTQTKLEGGVIGFTFQIETHYDPDAAAQGVTEEQAPSPAP